MNPLTFKQNLKYLRSRARLSQEQMAAILNISRSCLGSWEEGRACPNVVGLVELCDLLKIEDLRLLLTEDMQAIVEEGHERAKEVTAIVRRLGQLEEKKPGKRCRTGGETRLNTQDSISAY